MKVLEGQITIVTGGHEPTKPTGETGGSRSSAGLGQRTLTGHLLKQAHYKLNRKA